MEWQVFDIRSLSDDAYHKWYSCMSDARAARIDRFRSATDKALSIAGEMLARQMISAQCHVAPETISLAVARGGKPYAENLPIHFSISHAGELAVCAVDRCPIGIDIERLRPVSAVLYEHVRTSFPGTEELPPAGDAVTVADPHALHAFFRVWTRHEAIYKSAASDCEVIYPQAPPGYVICIAKRKNEHD